MGCPTVADIETTPKFRVIEQMGSIVPEVSKGRTSTLLVYSARVRGYDQVMSLLVNSGASKNFVKLAALKKDRRVMSRFARMASEKKRSFV